MVALLDLSISRQNSEIAIALSQVDQDIDELYRGDTENVNTDGKLESVAYANKVRGATRRKNFVSMVKNCRSRNALFLVDNVFPAFDGKKGGGTSSHVFIEGIWKRKERPGHSCNLIRDRKLLIGIDVALRGEPVS